MGRVCSYWTEDYKVANFEVAPHRYRWDREFEHYDEDDYKAWLATVPYKEKEVVYFEEFGQARKALIMDIFYERDRYGDRREKYRVLFETQKGTFSKLYSHLYPGQIQRGYKCAGLAPEMPQDD